MVSGIYDVLNGFYLDIQIREIPASEIEVSKDGLNHLKEIVGPRPVVLLFDRGYPSIEFVNYLENTGYS